MSQHARIEELSDSDSDPPEDDLDDFNPADIIRSTSTTDPENPPPAGRGSFNTTNQPPPEYKTYQCIYPVYFDASRSRAEGRRVGKEQAVPNPLAREIVDAVQLLGLKTVFEPGKMHPKDWSNPGRVRVGLKEGGRGRVKNKHHLYNLISQHLKQNPTTESSPLRLRIQGMPTPDGPLPPPAIPKGWKLNTILPLHSPAVSGGGVSENILKDMMQEMQGAGGQGNPMASLMGDMGGGGGGDGGGGDQGGGGGGAAQGKRKREREKKR